jgi:hypothetical protein
MPGFVSVAALKELAGRDRVLRQPGCFEKSHQQILFNCCILITIVMSTTGGAIPLSDIKWQLIQNAIAARTLLRTRKESVNFYKLTI